MIDVSRALSQAAIFAVPFLLGVTCHELAHGLAAFKKGDRTAYMLGRLTLNPLKHLDPVGTALFFLTAVTGPFVFGWAKPVPVNPRWFKNIRRDMMLVSLAGPAANLVLVLFFAFMAKIIVFAVDFAPESLSKALLGPLYLIALAGIRFNVVLAVFNLLPIPPLDGSRVVSWLLPRDAANWYESLERWGFFILILLLATGLIGHIVGPIIVNATLFVFILFELPFQGFL